MVKAKVGGIVVGGLAAYLILSKSLNVLNNCVRNICVAHEWKNYYKYGRDREDMVPPGYSMHTRPVGDDKEVKAESPEQVEANEKQAQNDASSKPVGTVLADAIVKSINDIFFDKKKAEGASEGDLEASTKAEKGTDEMDVGNIVELRKTAEEMTEPLYVDSLENGVEIVNEDEGEEET